MKGSLKYSRLDYNSKDGSEKDPTEMETERFGQTAAQSQLRDIAHIIRHI